MRQEMPDGHGLGRRSQPIGRRLHRQRIRRPRAGESRQIFFDRVFDRKAALLGQLHGGGRSDGFRHRRDPEQRIELERTRLSDVSNAEGALVDDTLRSAAMTHNAGNLLAATAPRIASSMAEDDWGCWALAANARPPHANERDELRAASLDRPPLWRRERNLADTSGEDIMATHVAPRR